jgi:hypothetical protein
MVDARGGNKAYPFVEVVAPELDGRVWHDANAIGAIASHEASPALFTPHFFQPFTDRHFVCVSASTLDLEKNL